jgi:hypothetical protein
MKRVLLLFCLLSVLSAKSFSQKKSVLRNNFYEAEMFVLYEEYKEALPLYMGLLKAKPTNFNYKYRIGQCLINMPGRKQEAIVYLEDAIKNINLKYKEGRFKEAKAPYDAYYYLANAYRINNQLTKALDTYELFKKNLDTEVYDVSVVNLQIESCLNAQQLMKVPIYIKKENLGGLINDRFSDNNPVVSGDESILVYNKAASLQDFIYFSKKLNGTWSVPVNIIPDLGLGNEYKNFATSISADGRELYIYRPGDDYDGNIFVTRRDNNDRWSNLVILNDNINTKFWESHATISHDGRKLYFTSNRKGTYGGLDIYVSQRDSTGDWGPAKNLGATINTVYNEESPFLGNDDKTLFFSSRGHYNMGGYDIFYSTLLANGEWSVPVNLGYPLNTTDDDVFYNPVKNGYQAYYAMDDSGGYGLQDIYRIEIFSKDHPRKFFVSGIVQVKDLLVMFGDSIKVSAFKAEDPNASVIVYSNPVTGEYKFELPQGNYSLTYEAEGAEKAVKNLDLPFSSPTDSFVIPGLTLPKTDFIAEMFIGMNKTMSVVKGDTIAIPLKVEPKSILVVGHWLGDSLLSSDRIIIKEATYTHKIAPKTGDNRVVFNLTDRFSNTATSDILIKRKKLVIDQPVIRPEYRKVIAQKQTDAFVNMLKNRADDNLKKVIERSDIDKQKFGKADDIISYVKAEAAKSSITPTAVDLLALRVAVMDNVLTQAAVDLLAQKTQGELKEILTSLNIYDAGLKTWTDLQEYISAKTNGRIKPEDLTKIATDILADIDPAIAKIRDKILAYSENNIKGILIKKSVSTTDLKNIKESGKWVQSVYNESFTSDLKETDMAFMFSALSSLPGTETEKYIAELSGYADDALKVCLNGPEVKKAKYKTPKDLLLFLFRNKDKGLYPELSLFDALAKLIAAKDIPAYTIASQVIIPEENWLWILWAILGAGLISIFIIFRRRKKREKKVND